MSWTEEVEEVEEEEDEETVNGQRTWDGRVMGKIDEIFVAGGIRVGSIIIKCQVRLG